MGMTKEQLIREMIQIELLYRTRQQLKKNKLNESDETENNTPSPITQKSTESTEIVSGQKNKFILDNFKNFKVNVKVKVIDKQMNLFGENDGAVTQPQKICYECKYSELEETVINSIWEEFNNKIQSLKYIPKNIADRIIEKLKGIDTDTTQNKENFVFHVFNDIFKIDSIDYGEKGDAVIQELKDVSKNAVKKDLYYEIYRMDNKPTTEQKKSNADLFGAGRGEFITVLLTKGAKSGGGKKLDIDLGNGKFCEVKQITDKKTALMFSYNKKSKIIPAKNNFVETYQRIINVAISLKDEFKKLAYINKGLIDQLNEIPTSDSYISFSSDSSSNLTVSEDQDPTAISLPYLNLIFKEAILGLKNRTYNRIIDNKKNIDSNINKNKKIQPDVARSNAMENYVNKTGIISTDITKNKIPVNVSKEVLEFFKNNYNLNLKSYAEYIKSFSTVSSEDAEEYESFNTSKGWKWIEIPAKTSNDNIKYWFKKLDIDDYNQKLDNIIGPIDQNVADYFKLDNQIPIIRNLRNFSRNQIDFDDFKKKLFNEFRDSDSLKDISKSHTYSQTGTGYAKGDLKDIVRISILGKIKENLIDNKSNNVPTDWSIPATYKNIPTNSITIDNVKFAIYKDELINNNNYDYNYVHNNFKNIKYLIYNLCNCRIVLNDSEMSQIADIIKSIKNLHNEFNTKDKNRLSQSTQDNNDFIITEPINSQSKGGEYTVDINYYKNNRKQHVDTLHSQDLAVKSNVNNYKKEKGQEQRIGVNVSGNEATTPTDVTIDLEGTISDKNTINNKLKRFELFNTLQPTLLIDLFTKNQNQNQPKLDKVNSTSNENTDNITKQDEFLELLAPLKNDTEEKLSKGLLGDYYELYKELIKLEEEIKDYYTASNDTLIFVEDDASSEKSNSAFYKNVLQLKDTFNSETANNEGIIISIHNKGINCIGAYDDNYTKPNAMKKGIRSVFLEIFKLMIEVQDMAKI